MGSEFCETTIGEQITLQRGFDITKKEQKPGDVPVVSSGGVSSFHNESKVKAPGVVLGRKGSLGTVFYMDSDFWPHDTTLWVKDFKNNNPRFIYYFFINMADVLKKMDVGAANPALNRNHVHPLSVIWPDPHHQKQISNILGILDDKIELNRQINTTFEAMAQALFKSWFVDFDPVIDNALAAGNPIPNELADRAERRQQLHASRSTGPHPLPAAIQQLFPDRFVFTEEMGWVPEGWEINTVGDVVEVTGGGTPSTKNDVFWKDGCHAFCTPKDMSRLTSWMLMDTERHLTDAGVKKVSSGQLPSGSVLMSSRAPIGYLAVNNVPVSVNQGIIAMLSDASFGPLYLLNWVKSNMDNIIDRANGSTFLEISKKNFRSIPFLVPNSSASEAFNKEADAICKRILGLAAQNINLTNLRDILLPKLLSGQLRIPEAEQLLAEAL